MVIVCDLEVLTPVPVDRTRSECSQTRPPSKSFRVWFTAESMKWWRITARGNRCCYSLKSSNRYSLLLNKRGSELPALWSAASSVGSHLRPRLAASQVWLNKDSPLSLWGSRKPGAFVLRDRGHSHLLVVCHFTQWLEMATFSSGHNIQGDSWSHHPAKFSWYKCRANGDSIHTARLRWPSHWRWEGMVTHTLPLQSQAGKNRPTFFLSHSHQRLEIKTLNCVLGFSSGTWVLFWDESNVAISFYLTPSLQIDKEKIDELIWLFQFHRNYPQIKEKLLGRNLEDCVAE